MSEAEDSIPEDLISPARARRILRCGLETVYRWIQRGQLRAWRVGGTRYMVSEAEVRGKIRRVIPDVMPPAAHELRSGAEAAMNYLRNVGALGPDPLAKKPRSQS